MKLYEAKFWKSKDSWDYETRYVSTRKDAGKLIRGRRAYRLAEVTLIEGLNKAILIQLLESDAPGNQPQEFTPMDMIKHRKVLKEKYLEKV